jgi:hypothetical protein
MPNWLFCAVESTIRYVPSTGKYSALYARLSSRSPGLARAAVQAHPGVAQGIGRHYRWLRFALMAARHQATL